MKRLSIILLSTIVFGLVSCGSSQKEEVSQELIEDTETVEQRTTELDASTESLENEAEEAQSEVDSLLQDI